MKILIVKDEKMFAKSIGDYLMQEKADYEVNFELNSKEMSAVFTSTGQFLEKEEEIAMKDLPVKAVAYLKQQYSHTKIKEVARITKANGTIEYEAEVNKTDLVFTEGGDLKKK